MAAQSWPELADNTITRLAVEPMPLGFWIILVVVAYVAWPMIRRTLISVLEGAVHSGINGTAEKVAAMKKEMDELLERQAQVEKTLAYIEGMVSKGLTRSYNSREGDTGLVTHSRKPRP